MLKKYDNIADYNNAQDRSSSISEIALVEDGTGIKVHGVNVQVEHPQKGDIAYLDASRNLKYILHDTFVAASFDAACDVIGVIGEIVGDKAIIIALDANSISAKYAAVYQWKVTNSAVGSGTLTLKHNNSAAVTYALTWTGVTTDTAGKQTLAAEIQECLNTNSDTNWSCYYDADEDAVIMQLDNYSDYRFTTPSCTGITFTAFMDEVPATSATAKMQNGNFSTYPSWNHLRTAEWASTNGTKTTDTEATGAYPAEAIMSLSAFNSSTNMKAKYGTYENYCASTLPMVPRWDKGVFSFRWVGEEYTKLYGAIKYRKPTDTTEKTGYKYAAMARCLQYQPNVKTGHTIPAGCVAEAGNWHLGDPLEMFFIMRGMNTTSANTTVANYDVVNRNIVAAGGTKIGLAAFSWSVLRLSATVAWSFNGYGLVYSYYFSYSYRALPLLTVKI